VHGAADEGAQHRPHLEEQILVETVGQVVVQALVQDGAVQTHRQAAGGRGDAVQPVLGGPRHGVHAVGVGVLGREVVAEEVQQLGHLPSASLAPRRRADLGVLHLPACPDLRVEVVLEVQVALGECVAGCAGFLGQGDDGQRAVGALCGSLQNAVHGRAAAVAFVGCGAAQPWAPPFATDGVSEVGPHRSTAVTLI
jgi:hypothetical protein